jgi:hypothetical protein
MALSIITLTQSYKQNQLMKRKFKQ